jgi:CheY-like chemotaxis protein
MSSCAGRLTNAREGRANKWSIVRHRTGYAAVHPSGFQSHPKVRGAMKSILLVEDDEALGYSLARQLETRGYKVTVVLSSMTALNVLDSDTAIDLLVADLVMPTGQPSGLALGRRAKMKRPRIQLVFISRYELDENLLPRKLFRKPLAVDGLMTEIGTLLSA